MRARRTPSGPYGGEARVEEIERNGWVGVVQNMRAKEGLQGIYSNVVKVE